MSQLTVATTLLDAFRGGSLRQAIAELERTTVGLTSATAWSHLDQFGVGMELLLAALLIKRSAAQINEIVHAVGILLALPRILEPREAVEGLSLAAGNTGKGFDLETTNRVAEFTFIQWRGGSEVIRQNKIFKDFYFLAEADTTKRRELYVVGTAYPAKFFESGRALEPILRGNDKLGTAFHATHGNSYATVRDYYLRRRHLVTIRDLGEIIRALRS
jgi:hypothetical protein